MHTRPAPHRHHGRRFRKSGPFCASFGTAATLKRKSHAICREIEKRVRVWQRATGSVGVLEAGWCALLLSFHGDPGYIWQRDARRQLGLARLCLLLSARRAKRGFSPGRLRPGDTLVCFWGPGRDETKGPVTTGSQQPEQQPTGLRDVFGLWQNQTSRLGFIKIKRLLFFLNLIYKKTQPIIVLVTALS